MSGPSGHVIQKRDTSTGKAYNETTKVSHHWWLEPDNRIYQSVWSVVETIESRQRARWVLALIYASLYENVTRLGLNTGSRPTLVGFRVPNGGVVQAESLGSNNKSAHNVIRSCVCTAAARVAKEEPRVKFTTTEGSWSDQQRAKRLTEYLDGVFYDTKAYEIGPRVFTDGLVFDAGFMHIFIEHGKVKIERVIPLEIIVDDQDGAHGTPRQMHRKREVPREVLKAAYPESAAELDGIQSIPTHSQSASDDVVVIESWHLPSGPDEKDGKHTICTEKCTLLSEPYEKPWFPFVKFVWTERVAGYWGMGLTEELSGMQLRLNKIDKQIIMAQQFACVPRCFVEEGSNVNQHSLFDFGVVKYRGTAPTFNTSPGMANEVYSERDGLIDRMYALSGISQMSASAQKPAGLDSEPALREYNDQVSERFALQQKSYERMFVAAGLIIISLSRDLHKKDPELHVNTRSRKGKFLKRIKWAECNLEDDMFMMHANPVSNLPTTPPARLKYVQELIQGGFIDKETGTELLQLLDVDDSLSIASAAFDCAMFFIEEILEHGRVKRVEPYLNLALTFRLSQASYLRAVAQGAPEENLQLLRNFMDELQFEMETLKGTSGPTGGLSGPGPTGGMPIDPKLLPASVPAPPPTSDLLPIGA